MNLLYRNCQREGGSCELSVDRCDDNQDEGIFTTNNNQLTTNNEY